MTPSKTGPAIVIFADGMGPSSAFPVGVYEQGVRFPYYNSYWQGNTADPTTLLYSLGQVFAQSMNGGQPVFLAYHCTGDPSHPANTLFKLATTANTAFPSTLSSWLTKKYIVPGDATHWPQIIAVDYIDINTNANLAQVVALNIA